MSSPASVKRARRHGVVDRLVRGAVPAVPLERAPVQLRHEVGLAPLELDAQDLREQVVEAVPLRAVVEREEEQVRPRERLQGACRSRLSEDRAAQRCAEPFEHRGAEHERLQLRVVGGEHLAGEEVDDMGARAVERADERALVLGARQRERGEVDPGGPALRAGDQELDVGRREPQVEAIVEELRRPPGRVKRRSSARSSWSCPRARSVPSGSAGSVRVDRTSCTEAGMRSTSQATLSRVDGAVRRWKSSSTSASSGPSASAFTSRGSTTSSSGAAATSGAIPWPASSGHARSSAATTCAQRTTASSSPSSSVTQATGRRRDSLARHAASSVDLPKPAGHATRLSRLPRPSRSRWNRRSRATVCAGTTGGCSFVSRRIGASGRLVVSSAAGCTRGIVCRLRGLADARMFVGGAVLRPTSDSGAHAAGPAEAKVATSRRDAGRTLPFPAGHRERESRRRRLERSTR